MFQRLDELFIQIEEPGHANRGATLNTPLCYLATPLYSFSAFSEVALLPFPIQKGQAQILYLCRFWSGLAIKVTISIHTFFPFHVSLHADC